MICILIEYINHFYDNILACSVPEKSNIPQQNIFEMLPFIVKD